MTVQIVRLKDGSDVICYTEKENNTVELDYPMMFSVVNSNLVLQHWLPLSVMKGTSVKIPLEEVVCFMDPNENFEDYYVTAVKKINSVMDSNNDDIKEEMMEALNELETSKGIKIH